MSYDYYGELSSLVPGLAVATVFMHLNCDYTQDDEEYLYVRDQLIPTAYMHCESFLNRNVFPDQATWWDYEDRYENPEVYPPEERPSTPAKYPMIADRRFVQAVLLTVGHLFRNREDTTAEKLIELPGGSRSLLWPLRRGLGI